MIPKTVKVELGGTMNLGDYQNAKISVAWEVELEAGEELAGVTQSLTDQLRPQMAQAMWPIVSKRLTVTKEQLSLLPPGIRIELEAVLPLLRFIERFDFPPQITESMSDEDKRTIQELQAIFNPTKKENA